nr:MAG TPA: hypothetical protein [Caudoviricetes sp.]
MQHHIQNTPPTRTHRRCAATVQPQVSTTVNALNRLKQSAAWLESHGIRVIGYCGLSGEMPEITVQAGPKTFALFSGRYEQRVVGHDGVCKYAEWEAIDSARQVRICWTEVTS